MRKLKLNIFNVRLIFLLMLFLMLPKFASAYGSPDFLPDGAHPRIFLTSAKLADLTAKVSSNDADWLELKARADAYTTKTVQAYPTSYIDGTIYYNYQGAGWLDAIFTLSLAYKVTGNTAYAAKAKEVVDAMNTAGNAALIVDSGYPTRNICFAMAIAYDWLYDYLDSSTKTSMITTVNNWYDWYKISAYMVNDSTGTSNYLTGHIKGVGLLGLATYGENARAQEISQFVRGKWDSHIVNAFTSGAFSGGTAIEAYSSYGAGAFVDLLDYVEATETATGENILSNFGDKIAAGLIYNTKPNGWQMTDEATQSVNYAWILNSNLPLRLARLLSGSNADQMNYYYNHLAPTPVVNATDVYQKSKDYERFLYKKSAPEEDYKAVRSLFYHSSGDEHLFSRSDWSTSATWSSFNGNSLHYAGHQQQIGGHISLERGSDYLLVNAGQWRGTDGFSGSPRSDLIVGVAGNTLYFNDGGAYNRQDTNVFEGGQEWSSTGNNLKFEGTENYAYGKADLTGAYYTDRYGFPISSRTLTHFFRNYISIDGGKIVFVYDRIRATSAAYTKRLQWYLNPLNMPVINGSTVTSDVGNSRLHLKTVFPLDATTNLSIDPVTQRNGIIYGKRLEISGPSSVDFNPLTVMLATDNTTVTPNITGIDALMMQGALVETSIPQISLFSKDGVAQNSVTYAAAYSSGTTGNHLIVDLVPGNYDVYRDGTKILSNVVASSQGVLSFSATGGTNFQVTSGAPDLTAPAAPSGLSVL
jgi:hypothetical protein